MADNAAIGALPPKEDLNLENLLANEGKHLYVAMGIFQADEFQLMACCRRLKIDFDSLFVRLPRVFEIELDEQQLSMYRDRPMWEACYHLQIDEFHLRKNCLRLSLDYWGDHSSKTSSSAAPSSSAASSTSNARTRKRRKVDDVLFFLVEYDGLNHLFQLEKRGLSYSKILAKACERLKLREGAFRLEFRCSEDKWAILESEQELKDCLAFCKPEGEIRLTLRARARAD